MSKRLIYTGNYLDKLPIKKGERCDVRIVQLSHENPEGFIVEVNSLYNYYYKSLDDFMKFWKKDYRRDPDFDIYEDPNGKVTLF